MKIFISYCHKQGEWVWNRLVPCLKAGGVDYIIDRERFELGKDLVDQMKDQQDRADKQLLLLSKEYLNSTNCNIEMKRAIQNDPDFKKGTVLPVIIKNCDPPQKIKKALYADLRDDRKPDQWKLVLDACNADLGITAPAWLKARDEVVTYLKDKHSVNLIINNYTQWLTLIDYIKEDHFKDMGMVDLENPATTTRSGFITEIVKSLELRNNIPPEPDDLVEFSRIMEKQDFSRVALLHFDYVQDMHSENEINLFRTFRYMINTERKMAILFVSHSPFDTLIPKNHPLSEIHIEQVRIGN